ncbi:MAG: hypothetical protein ACYC96_05205 [Fimbriimonadaceae bacterium]
MTIAEALAELDCSAPGVPLLALGQTVFWDEPMKAGVAQAVRKAGGTRRFIAGVHDTDYFAKAHLRGGRRRFQAMPHNDTSTRDLWSAAGEFSALFGSETVVTRDLLAGGGLKFRRLTQARPTFLDEATEAWGWKGISYLGDDAPVTADVSSPELIQELEHTLRWALDLSLACLTGDDRAAGQVQADALVAMLCNAFQEDETDGLGGLYERLLRELFEFAAKSAVEVDTTRTTRLLRFNSQSCRQPRFELLDLFLRPNTRDEARAAYNEAVRTSGLYTVERFGTGAVPFDVYVPGRGRGTLRIGARGLVINTPKPLFASLKQPIEGVADLAAVLESKLGSDIAIVGKAVTLIGMLGREYSFVFHEGASSYVSHSRKLHELLSPLTPGGHLDVHPILRVKYDAWSALSSSCSWLRLPELLRRPFGTDELCSPSLAGRWKHVACEQRELLVRLGELKRPIDLIEFLNSLYGGSWHHLADEYARLQKELNALREQIALVRAERVELYKRRNKLKEARRAGELAMGEHFRAHVFEKHPDHADLAKRDALAKALRDVVAEQELVRELLIKAFRRQSELAHNDAVRGAHQRRRDIEIEAELKRATIIREAVVASKGLEKASQRPSAWWFSLVSPDGLWFRETVDAAEAYLEPLC